MIHWPSRTNTASWFLLMAWTDPKRSYWSWAVHFDARPRVWLMPWMFSRRYVRICGLEYRNQFGHEGTALDKPSHAGGGEGE